MTNIHSPSASATELLDDYFERSKKFREQWSKLPHQQRLYKFKPQDKNPWELLTKKTEYLWDTVWINIGDYPLKPNQMQQLERHCRRKFEPEDKPTWQEQKTIRWVTDNGNTRERKYWLLHLSAPTNEAFKLIRRWRFSPKVTYVEPAMNRISDHPEQLEEYYKKHVITPYNRQPHTEVGRTNYVGQKKGNQRGQRQPQRTKAYYGDNICKRTEELCFHLEDRISTSYLINKLLGIRTISDLITFNHQQYWNRRLQFFDIDYGKLGLQLKNQESNTRRRRATRSDEALGKRTFPLWMNSYKSLQEYVRVNGRQNWMIRRSTPISNPITEDTEDTPTTAEKYASGGCSKVPARVGEVEGYGDTLRVSIVSTGIDVAPEDVPPEPSIDRYGICKHLSISMIEFHRLKQSPAFPCATGEGVWATNDIEQFRQRMEHYRQRGYQVPQALYAWD